MTYPNAPGTKGTQEVIPRHLLTISDAGGMFGSAPREHRRSSCDLSDGWSFAFFVLHRRSAFAPAVSLSEGRVDAVVYPGGFSPRRASARRVGELLSSASCEMAFMVLPFFLVFFLALPSFFLSFPLVLPSFFLSLLFPSSCLSFFLQSLKLDMFRFLKTVTMNFVYFYFENVSTFDCTVVFAY